VAARQICTSIWCEPGVTGCNANRRTLSTLDEECGEADAHVRGDVIAETRGNTRGFIVYAGAVRVVHPETMK